MDFMADTRAEHLATYKAGITQRLLGQPESRRRDPSVNEGGVLLEDEKSSMSFLPSKLSSPLARKRLTPKTAGANFFRAAREHVFKPESAEDYGINPHLPKR